MQDALNAKIDERRGRTRVNAGLNGCLKFGPELTTDCEVLDVSVTGVQVLLTDTVPLNSDVTLILPGSVHFGGEVVWRHGLKVGLKFRNSPEKIAERLAGVLNQDTMRQLHS
ncbi:PilZ domain-containing protein [Kiloniella laminariae]|uniref:PilZ domain-containing protein n=1 Tax=Kiloniella laminariae TaxID=454162 RepID=UPI000362E1A0|nr:PilZ domain-containing protein [Kiloniella laminariae]